ncbi:hypothetical protein HHI36_017316 [Cryptolaemus montrouzieri]|uniref:Uncharacterized protein n=1 Tax=Cryptolaemus montrouzieri TaxID=559131 RepID=A0ABD2NM64_9CUCU
MTPTLTILEMILRKIPKFQPPETNQTVRNFRESGSSSSREDEDDLVISVSSPASLFGSSTSSNLSRGRRRSRRTSRGPSRGRSRGRGENSQLLFTLQIAIRNRQNNACIQDNWIKETLDTEIINATCLHQENTEAWECYQVYEEYVVDEISDHIVLYKQDTSIRVRKIYRIIFKIIEKQYRLRLKCVYDPEVTPEQKFQNMWKIQPSFDRLLAGCHEQDRPQEMKEVLMK